MSLAKYAEDNMEIMQERMYMKYHNTETVETGMPYKFPVIVVSKPAVPVQEETPVKEKKRRKITLICEDCGQEFLFTKRDQHFFEEKGWCQPKRCKACRNAKKVNYHLQTAS